MDGTKVNPLTSKGTEAFVFIMSDCPISNEYAPELERIRVKYEAKSVRFCLVFVDADLDVKKARTHLAAYGLGGSAVLDPLHSLAKRSGATVSPEAVVYAKGKLVYRGRIDNRVVSHGQSRPSATRRDFRLALDAALAGKGTKIPNAPAVGCIFRA